MSWQRDPGQRRIGIELLKLAEDDETFGYEWTLDPRNRQNAAAITRWEEWAKQRRIEVQGWPGVAEPDRSYRVQATLRQHNAQEGVYDRRGELPLEHGTLSVGEDSSGDLTAGDGTVSFRTGYNEEGDRGLQVSVQGTKYAITYFDLDGDGRFDALNNLTQEKLFIRLDGEWREVFRQKIGLERGVPRVTADTRVSYTFAEGEWRRSEEVSP